MATLCEEVHTSEYIFIEYVDSKSEKAIKENIIVTSFHSGQTGDWKNHLSPEMNFRINEWMAENLKNSDLKFITEDTT